MKAAIRPKGVILKYKELIREAARDEQTLINLENNYKDSTIRKSKSRRSLGIDNYTHVIQKSSITK